MPSQLQEIATFDLGAGQLPADGSTDWSKPEDGRRWALGRKSTLRFSPPAVDGELVLLLTVDPFVCAALPKQTLRIVANGATVRLARFGRRAIIACRVSPALLRAGAQLTLEFQHPETVQPNMVSESADDRPLSIGFVRMSLASWSQSGPRAAPNEESGATERLALPPETSLSDAELVKHFASLGDNCEFGMAQRMAGSEPMDLLRFSALPLSDLKRGIDNGFANIESFDDLQFEVRVAGGRREYVLHQRGYQLESHTMVEEGQMSVVRLYRREMNKLTVNSRLFRGDLRDGRRIFVFKRNDITQAEYVLPMLDSLIRWGPNTLLQVIQGDAVKVPGTVEKVGPGLLRGYIDRFSTYDNAAIPPSPVWLQICRNSYRIWQRDRMRLVADMAKTETAGHAAHG